jgi:hypothetical protein
MSLLHELTIRAKWDGECTLEWAALRNSISSEACLVDVPGKSDIQKLRAWAERQGLLMDFDLHFAGCTSEIRTVTFWNPRQTVDHEDAGPSGAAEDRLCLRS